MSLEEATKLGAMARGMLLAGYDRRFVCQRQLSGREENARCHRAAAGGHREQFGEH